MPNFLNRIMKDGVFMNLFNIFVAAILLVVIVGMFLVVSYYHKKDGLGDVCSGNCASCTMAADHNKNCKKN